MNAIVQTQKPSLVAKFSSKFSIEPEKLLTTLKATAFRQRDANKQITNEQMASLLIVADQYGLNPFTKEIFAFEDKGAIIPVVSVDGWLRIINGHPMMSGIEFRYSEKMEQMPDGKPCPEWCEAVITRKDRNQPIVVREYLDEVYIGKRNNYAGPWQTHTKRMLRWKALIQGSRVAFGFAGIYDEDEAGRIIEGHATVVTDDRDTSGFERKLVERAKPEDSPEPTDLQRIQQRMANAQDRDELDAVCEGVSLLPEKADRVAAMATYEARLAEIEAGFGNPDAKE